MLRRYRVCIAFAIASVLGVLAGCSGTERPTRDGATASGTTPHESAPLPDGYKLGRPYDVFGVTYYPYHDPAFVEEGVASWYGAEFHGRKTASGEPYDMNAVTAAHKTLPMPSTVKVTNLVNGRTLLVRVNDRGPFVGGRVIDLSRRSAQLLGVYATGTAPVKVEFVQLASLTPPGTGSETQYAEIETIEETTSSDDEPVAEGDPEPVKLWSKKDKAAEEREPVRVKVKPKPREVSTPPVEVATIEEKPAKKPKQADRKPTIEVVAVGEAEAKPIARPKAKPAAKAAPKRDGGGFLISSANAAEIEEAAIEPAARTPDIFVQVGAFATRDSATQLKTQLAPMGRIFVQPSQSGGRSIFRVRFGPMADHDAANSLLDRLIQSGYTTAKLIVEAN